MIWPVIIAGFTLGAVGSLHCVGMCGPLSLALPTQHLSGTRKFLSLLLYQVGRIITYSIFGLLFGLAGRSIYMAGIQQRFSILLGVIILLLSLFYFLRKTRIRLSFLDQFYIFIQQLISGLLRKAKGPAGFFLMGVANGFLPCGMVYLAVAAAISSTGISQAVAFMAAFGAGTLPAMMIVAYLGQVISLSVRRAMRKAVPYFVVIMAVVLILRGLNLGIPYISPDMPAQSTTDAAINCH